MASSLYRLAGKPHPCVSQPGTTDAVQQVTEPEAVPETLPVVEDVKIVNDLLSDNSGAPVDEVPTAPEETPVDDTLSADAVPEVAEPVVQDVQEQTQPQAQVSVDTTKTNKTKKKFG